MSLKFAGSWTQTLARFARKPLDKLALTAAIGIGAFGLADRAESGQLFTGQHGTGGTTWNVYERIDTGLTFEDAWRYAQNAPDPTGGSTVGHLVVLTTQAENDFVNDVVAPGDRWIGLSDRVGVAPGATESLDTPDALTMGWAWVNGEPFVFNAWGGGEPNDASSGEDAGQLRGDGLWNDNESGFNFDEPAVDPAGRSEEEAQTVMQYAIEWSKNAGTQPTVPASRPNPFALDRAFPTPLARLPGPTGTASGFGVREIRDLGPAKNSRDGVTKIASGAGTITNGTAARIDLRDPDTNAGNTGSSGGTEVPFLTDTPGVDDEDIQTVIKGTFQVPAGQGGAYTFSGRSDDGFAMRILSQATPTSPVVQHKFTAHSNGHVDIDGSLVFLYPTGDSNTQGLINLAPGAYDVEFTAFENGGGAFWELSTAKGDFVNPAPNTAPQYVLLGDPSSRAGITVKQPARLTGAINVRNYDGAPGTIQTAVDDLRLNPTGATSQGTADTFVLTDPDDVCCGRPGGALPNETSGAPVRQFDFPNVGVDVPHDDFRTAVTGSFQVLDTNGAAGEQLTFGLFADDYFGFRIKGQNFTGVSDFDVPTPDGNIATLGTPAGETDTWVLADYFTGNTNAFGLISLTEGTYEFEAFQGEGGGDSGMELWVASGDKLATGFNAGTFFPLTTATMPDRVQAPNTGLALVAGPGTGPAAGAPGDFDLDGDVDGRDFLVYQRGGAPGGVTPANLQAFRNNFGAGAVVAGGAVPEPSSLGLALAVAGVLAGCVRRRPHC